MATEKSDMDRKILTLLRVMFKLVKKAEKNNKFPIFSPLGVLITSKRKVQLKINGTTNKVSESLRTLGLTVYHLIKGESEINRESYKFDGYESRPLDSLHWTILQYLLSGKANDLFYLKKYLSRFDQWKKFVVRSFYSIKDKIKRQKSINDRGSNRKFVNKSRSAINEKKIIKRLSFEWHWNIFFVWFTFSIYLLTQVALVIVAVLFFDFVEPFYHQNLILVIIPLFICFFFWILVLVLFPVFRPSASKWSRNCWIQVVLGLIIVGILFYRAGICAFATNVNGMESNSYQSFLVMDRFTGEVAGRISQDPNDKFFLMKSAKKDSFINPLEYQIKTGLGLSGKFDYDFDLLGVQKDKNVFSFKIKINYKLKFKNEFDYLEFIKQWPINQRLENDLRKYLDDELLPLVVRNLRETDILDNPGMFESEKISSVVDDLLKVYLEKPISPSLSLSIE